MAKRLVKKAAAKPPAKQKVALCSQQPCKKVPAYCRKEDGEMVSYCANHWKSVVESKKEFARAVAQHAKAEMERRMAKTKKKKKVVRRVKK
jgi:hypothetical protein